MFGQITLSRRNLYTLLHKLELPGSACMIIKANGTVVKVESDEAHYAGCGSPGRGCPATEDFIADMQKAVKIFRAFQLTGETPRWALDAAKQIVDNLADDAGPYGPERERLIRAAAAEIIEKLVSAADDSAPKGDVRG